MRRKNDLDYTLLAVAMALLSIGLVMVYSASAIWADQHLGDPLYFIKRQAIWAAISLGAMAFFSRLNYDSLKEWVWPALFVTVLGLIAALFSMPIAGVKRWVRVGPIGIQPSEFAKIASVLFMAYYLDRNRSKVESPVQGFLIPTGIVSCLLVLIGLEPDLGTPLLMFTVAMLVLFIGGGRLKYLFSCVLCALPLVACELVKYPYRRARMMSFLSPWEDAHGKGYQLVQSLLAVGSGGWLGKGVGASKLKLMYLPTPHTDFIFPVICEELGLLGAFLVLGLFCMFLVRGMRIARTAPNLFGTLLAAGITLTMCLQAFINIGMSIGLLPTKGMPLPFISFGGSSLLGSMIGLGILLNISRQSTLHPSSRLAVLEKAAAQETQLARHGA